jgi:hypothetical protein
MSDCPACSRPILAGQEYCLECGLRQPGPGRLGPTPLDPHRVGLSLAVAAVVAIAGAALAITLTRDADATVQVVTATGGSIVQSAPPTESGSTLVRWPAGTNGWTNVVQSVPKVEGRDDAVARAVEARQRGLPKVGVVDSSQFASLQPGYWVVFSGVYASEPEAAAKLPKARSVQRTARTQRLAR